MSRRRLITDVTLLGLLVSLAAPTAPAADILFISSMDPAHQPGDDALKAFIEGLGHTVTYFDDDEDEPTTEEAAAAADLVFISESVSSGDIREEITEIQTPMVITECWGWDEMGLTLGGGAGENVVTTDLTIALPEHPLAAGLSGTVPVLEDTSSTRGAARFGKGRAGEEATVVATATLADGQTYDVLFVYEKGAALPVAPADGSAQMAADIRVCLGFDEQSYLVWNENAYALLEAAIEYGLGILSDPGLASGPDPADGALAVLTPLFRWKASRAAMFHDVYLGQNPDLTAAELVGPHLPTNLYWHLPGLDPGVRYYWRVDEVDLDGTIHTGTVWTFVTQDLTAYYPFPADGATDASTSPTLTWLPGELAIRQHVYFSDNFADVNGATADADKGEVEEPTFVPGDLASMTPYYWRVNGILPDGTVRAGPVWTFMTYLPVDDFESYTDEEGSEVFATWLDGWLDQSSGSQVGYLEAPFTEQTIVHGGRQSMPLAYDNSAAPYFSEAKRQFVATQDWTLNGANTLVVHVRGRWKNAAEPLYVTARDSTNKAATVVHPDAAVPTAAAWTAWEVPLSDLADAGVNVARVKVLILGLGDPTNPTAGGTGLIFVDDIYVMRRPTETN